MLKADLLCTLVVYVPYLFMVASTKNKKLNKKKMYYIEFLDDFFTCTKQVDNLVFKNHQQTKISKKKLTQRFTLESVNSFSLLRYCTNIIKCIYNLNSFMSFILLCSFASVRENLHTYNAFSWLKCSYIYHVLVLLLYCTLTVNTKINVYHTSLNTIDI